MLSFAVCFKGIKGMLLKGSSFSALCLKAQHSENEDHGIWSHHFMANRRGNSVKQWLTLFFWAPKSLQMVITAMKLKDAYSLEGNL